MWRLPAFLSLIGFAAYPLSHVLFGLARGTVLRSVVGHLLSLGVCSAMLGAGLGVWIALRTRTLASFLTAVFCVGVAVLWWRGFFAPLVEGIIP